VNAGLIADQAGESLRNDKAGSVVVARFQVAETEGEIKLMCVDVRGELVRLDELPIWMGRADWHKGQNYLYIAWHLLWNSF